MVTVGNLLVTRSNLPVFPATGPTVTAAHTVAGSCPGSVT